MQKDNNLKREDNTSESDGLPQAEDSQVKTSPKTQNKLSLDKSQKIGVGLLAFFALFVIIMWSIQFERSIKSPFEYKGNATDSSQGGTNNNTPADLQNKDTDGDGLSDYDELNYYKTSPYLEDSDSDGFSDRDEIQSDNDPNCPTGRDCYSNALLNDETVPVSDENNLDNSSFNSILNQIGIQPAGTTDASGLTEILASDLSSADVRQLLIEAGMDKAVLDQIPDAELMQSFQEALAGQ